MQTLTDFVERYRATWQRVIRGEADVPALSPFFHLPLQMLDTEGRITLCTTVDALEEFNAGRRDAFRSGGAWSATVLRHDTASLGPHLSTVTVDWELQRADGSTERAWRHFYVVVHGVVEQDPQEPAILVSAFQPGS